MNIIDFIGFIFAFIALFFIYMRQRMEASKRQSHDSNDEQTYEEFIRSVEKYEEEERPKPRHQPPPPPRHHVQRPAPAAKPRALTAPKTSAKHDDAYGVAKEAKMSRGSVLVSQLKSPRDMFIYKEIFDKPLSMRDDPQRSKDRDHGRP